jgi:hypothetical protein
MNEREQKFVIKFLWLQGLGGKAIQSPIVEHTRRHRSVSFDCPTAAPSFQGWKHFVRGGRTMVIICGILRKFRAGYPFASAKVMSRHFGVSPSSVEEVPSRKLGFRKYGRRWVPYLLNDA